MRQTVCLFDQFPPSGHTLRRSGLCITDGVRRSQIPAGILLHTQMGDMRMIVLFSDIYIPGIFQSQRARNPGKNTGNFGFK